MTIKPTLIFALIVSLSLLSHFSLGAVHSLIANRIDNPSENRYSFCISSSHLPSTASFTAVLHFSFVDVDGQPIEFSETDSFVVGFPNAEFQLIRSHVSSANVLVHQGESSYFNWDAEAYLNTAHTTGVVVSTHRLVGVALIVESDEIVPVERNSKFTCDSPMEFIEDIIAYQQQQQLEQEQQAQQEIEQLPQQEIEQLPQLVDPQQEQEEQPIQIVFTNQEVSSTPTIISWIYLISILIVSGMSIACVARICCARRRYVEPADEEQMMADADADADDSQYQLVEFQQDEQPQQQQQPPQQPPQQATVIVHPQPVMTASGVQYILVPQEFLIAQQQQQQQQQQLQQFQQFQQLQQFQQPMNAGMFVYPGQHHQQQ